MARLMDRTDIPTMREVAERAGVALSSVSRVLNDHPDVSAKMRQRVTLAADSLGYQPDLLARSLRSGSTNTVGFVVRDISNPLFAGIVKGAEDTLRQGGYSTLLTNSEGEPDLDASYIRLFRRRRVDGLILSLGSETHPMIQEVLMGVRVPIVLLDREVAFLRASAVLCDHHFGVQAAVKHLLELGHRRVALIAGPREVRATRERVRGYLDAHHAAKLDVGQELIRTGRYTESYAYAETEALIDLSNPPTALLAGGIQLAYGALSALHERGLRIGRDVAFVSCDQTDLMPLFDTPISVVARDPVRMGQVAAEILVGMMEDEQPSRTEVLPTKYIPRASVAPPPA